MAGKMPKVNIFPILASLTKSVTSPYRSRLIFFNRDHCDSNSLVTCLKKKGYRINLQKLSSN